MYVTFAQLQYSAVLYCIAEEFSQPIKAHLILQFVWNIQIQLIQKQI